MKNINTEKALQEQFLRPNVNASAFAYKASEDYMLARVGMLNCLWSSFEMAKQATEKLIKSYLLFTDKSLNGKLRNFITKESQNLGHKSQSGHNVEVCLSLAEKAGLSASRDLKERIKRINCYDNRRYPDNKKVPTSLNTGELKDFDETIFEIWDAFEQLNEYYYYRGGIMQPVYLKLEQKYRGVTNNDWHIENSFQIITERNDSFNARKEKLVEGILSRLQIKYSHIQQSSI